MWCVVFILMAIATIPLIGPGRARADGGPDKGGPDKVSVGLYINDIQNIDLATNSYAVDFYLWLRWRNPKIDPSTSIEVMNSNALQNTTTSSQGGVVGKPLYPTPQDLPDGSRYMAMRYQGVFTRKMNLEKYPFDVQTLTLVFEDQAGDVGKIEYVPDDQPVLINDAVTIPGYRIEKPTLTFKQHRYPTNFGDTSSPPNSRYSRVIATIPVTREVLPYLVKIMLPIVIVILVTSMIYALPARLEEVRAGIGVTALLTIVALQWTTDSTLPSVEYLTMLDLIYILSMVYILAAMGYATIGSRRTRREMADAELGALDRRVGLWSLVLYAALVGLTIVAYVHHQRVDSIV